MLSEGAEFFGRMTRVMLYTHKALGLPGRPTKKAGFRWRPLLERMEVHTRHMRLNASGINALRSFTEIWDERLQQMEESKGSPNGDPIFSPSQIRVMSQLLADYEPWLRKNFPDAFLPPDHSKN
jgi:hypothetical protein